MQLVSTTLTALQTSAMNLLAADVMFSGSVSKNGKSIPIITEKKKDITQQIELCLGQVGIAALVLTPTFKPHNNLIPDLNGWALITVTIYENVTVNQGVSGTGIFAIALAEEIIGVLHASPHGVLSGATSGNVPPNFWMTERPLVMISDGPPLQINTSFQAHVQLQPVIQ
jgi:hypothetical protein